MPKTREEKLAYLKEWRKNNKEKIKKYRETRKKVIKEYGKEYFKAHRKAINATAKKRLNKLREYVAQYKLEHGCCICGYKKCAAALDLHHTENDKLFSVSSGMARGKKAILEEMGKCIIICSNCHREKHEKMKKENKA